VQFVGAASLAAAVTALSFVPQEHLVVGLLANNVRSFSTIVVAAQASCAPVDILRLQL
jgi:hypothetical protein